MAARVGFAESCEVCREDGDAAPAQTCSQKGCGPTPYLKTRARSSRVHNGRSPGERARRAQHGGVSWYLICLIEAFQQALGTKSNCFLSLSESRSSRGFKAGQRAHSLKSIEYQSRFPVISTRPRASSALSNAGAAQRGLDGDEAVGLGPERGREQNTGLGVDLRVPASTVPLVCGT